MPATVSLSPLRRLRRALLGAPIPTSKAHHERLSPLLGLPVFSSDALSSVAYATEAILTVLILSSEAALKQQMAISIAIVALIAIITISYQQTIQAYPSGGGSYIVASENLGPIAGVIAGAALLIDYILTVSVSVAAGVDSILSALPHLKHVIPEATVTISLFFILLVAYANLRGVRESGTLFAIPTYGFILSMFIVIGTGVYTALHTPAGPAHVETGGLVGKEATVGMLFITLRAFAAGCTALTGIEAVSNGVPAFKPPEQKNAQKTLIAMSCILAILFIGMGYISLALPTHYSDFRLVDSSSPRYLTLIAQIAAFGFGMHSFMYVATLGFTAAILILAANTAFADFPRLASLLARDGYLPRYLSRQGDRLVFHNGILVLAILSCSLIVVFGGKLDLLLPLYAIGVFAAFTLSQAGMVSHWWRLRHRGWQRSLVINGVGAVLCGIVLLILGYTKFSEGAWLVMLLIPLFCAIFWMIKLRYASMTQQLEISGKPKFIAEGHLSLLLVPRVHRGILNGLDYANQLRGECQAVHVTINEKTLPELQRMWDEYGGEVPLVVLPSPYRSLISPVLEYVDRIRVERPNLMITVIVSEAVSSKWYQRLLTESVALQLKNALARRKGVVVANVRYFLN
jgi:amino acid transporter